MGENKKPPRQRKDIQVTPPAPSWRETWPGRYDFDPPGVESWRKKSAYMLRRWQRRQNDVWVAFGLKSPVAVQGVPAFLRSVAPTQPASLGARMREQDAGAQTLPLGRDGLSALVFSTDDRALVLLDLTAGEIADDLHVTKWDAILYLLADAKVMVPWITVQRAGGVLGPGFSIRAGSAAVTGDELGSAYDEAKRQVFGIGSRRQVRENDIAIYLHEIESRERKETWDKSWERWQKVADETGANGYGGVWAYRNKVTGLCKRFDWMKEDLDRRKRPTGRPRRASSEEGGSA